MKIICRQSRLICQAFYGGFSRSKSKKYTNLNEISRGRLIFLAQWFLTQLLTYAHYIWVIFWRFFIFFLYVKFILLRVESDKTSNPGSILYHDRALFSWELVRIFISFFFRHENYYRQSGLIQFVRLFIIVPAALNPKIVRVLATFVVGAQLHLRNSC